jgi:polyisoprenoid-binding protein YceI
MHRGKIIGAGVLLVAVGLILAQQLGDSGVQAPADTGTGAGNPPTVNTRADIPAAQAGGAALAALPAAGESRIYTIDPAQSEVYWRIYRAGALAAAAHSHVISMTDFTGSVTLASDLADAQWSLSFPVAGLVIDDPELRARHGEEFESVPSEDEKSGTRRNMLSDRLLNGEDFPAINLTGTGVLGSLAAAELPVTIEIVGNSVELAFPASIGLTANELIVTGEARFSHEDLGLTPFSAFAGAIAVADGIDFSYRIHAIAGGQ